MLKTDNKYYYLVASLIPINNDNVDKLDAIDIRNSIKDAIQDDDKKELELLYVYYDIYNIINILNSSESQFNELGNLTEIEIKQEIKARESNDDIFETKLPNIISNVLDEYIENRSQNDKYNNEKCDNQLYHKYYELLSSSSIKYLQQWSYIDRAIKNIITGVEARNIRLDPKKVLVGKGEICSKIIKSNAPDFGLKSEFEYFDELWDIIHLKDIILREEKLDKLKFNIINEISEMNYFNMNVIMAYLTQINIIHRWKSINDSIGEKQFNMILDNFKVKL